MNLPANAIHTVRINKSFGRVQALKDISLEIRESELFGLIGPDGAGKTTLFRILASLMTADSGTATVNRLDTVKDFRQLRRQTGYMPGRFSLYPDLTVEENLAFFASVFHTSVKENYHLIKDIYGQIEPFGKRRAGKLSGGMKQKLALSCALIHKPKVLLLDEPTTGVDPVSRKEFWEMLKNLKKQGITIVAATPYMDEANRCDRIALMQEGQILAVETPENMVAAYPGKLYRIASADNFGLLGQLRENPAVTSCFLFGEYLHLTFREDPGDFLPGLEEIMPSVEDCFIRFLDKN